MPRLKPRVTMHMGLWNEVSQAPRGLHTGDAMLLQDIIIRPGGRPRAGMVEHWDGNPMFVHVRIGPQEFGYVSHGIWAKMRRDGSPELAAEETLRKARAYRKGASG